MSRWVGDSLDSRETDATPNEDAMPPETFDPLEALTGAIARGATKQRIVNVIRSYHNSVDVLAEPIQNAVDEVSLAHAAGDIESGHVLVRVNCATNTIEVIDNGRGISLEKIKGFIAPDMTDKLALFREGKTRGHKGVGLTFLAYGFDSFTVESRSAEGDHYLVSLQGGRSWAEDRDEDSDPPLAAVKHDPSDGRLEGAGTRIAIVMSPQTQPRELARAFPSAGMCATTLRRLTAIGVVQSDCGIADSFTSTLEYTSSSGVTESSVVIPGYLYPHDLEDHHQMIDLGNYIASNPDETEPPARHKSRYSAAYWTQTPDQLGELLAENWADIESEVFMTLEEANDYVVGHDIHAYALFAYSAQYRDSLAAAWSVPPIRRLHRPGVRIATDAMISTWLRDASLTHRGHNVDRLWLLFEFVNIEPDMGRKDFPPRVLEVVSLLEERVANDLIRKSTPFLRPTPRQSTSTGTYEEPAVKADRLLRDSPMEPGRISGYPAIPLMSSPTEEQDVVALFNELLGLGVFAHIRPVFFSGVDAYDAFFKISPDQAADIVQERLPGLPDPPDRYLAGTAEFKLQGNDLVVDLVSEIKHWEDIQFLVCWETGGAERSVGGDRIFFSPAESPADRIYAGVTHLATLQSGGTRPVYVIALKDLLDALEPPE